MTDIDRLAQAVAEQKGEIMFLQALLMATLRTVPPPAFAQIQAAFQEESELARVTILNSPVPDATYRRYHEMVEAYLSLAES